MAKKSRADRWAAAAADARAALDAIKEKVEAANEALADLIQEARDKLEAEIDADVNKLGGAIEELQSLQEEYADWYGNMPESLQSSPTGEKLSAIEGMDLSIEFELGGVDCDVKIESNLDEIEAIVGEAEGADLPMGPGRD